MLSVVNTLLISVTILVTLYILMNMKDDFKIFKGIYNDEQDYKHNKLMQIFGKLSTNDEQLKSKADEHNKKLANHEDRLVVHNTRLDDHKTKLDGHDTLLEGHGDRKAYAVLDTQASAIASNTSLINDKYSELNALLEGDAASGTKLKSSRAEVNMEPDGKIKINVENPDKVEICDTTGANCSEVITKKWLNENTSINVDGFKNMENFEEEKAPITEWVWLDENENPKKCFKGLPTGSGGDLNCSKHHDKDLQQLSGIQGVPGPKGVVNWGEMTPAQKAEMGALAPAGPKGPDGPRGSKGETGTQGPTGPAGVGSPGRRGSRGWRGHRGYRGYRGHRGYTGPQGDTTNMQIYIGYIHVKSAGLNKGYNSSNFRGVWVKKRGQNYIKRSTPGRSYKLTVFDKNLNYKGQWNYDVYGNHHCSKPSPSKHCGYRLRDKLKEHDNNGNILVINTWDEPRNNRSKITGLWDGKYGNKSNFHHIGFRHAYASVYQHGKGVLKDQRHHQRTEFIVPIFK